MNYLKYFFSAVVFILFAVFFTVNCYAFEYKNDDNISFKGNIKVAGTSVPATFALYSFNPEIIAGWNTPLYKHEKKYIPKKYHNLDILGGWYGNGITPNKEVLLSKKIDAAFAIGSKNIMINEMKKFMNSINIPFISITASTIDEDIQTYNILGELFHDKKRSDEINKYIMKSISNTKSITHKIKHKKKVYLALGDNGLKTRCVNSIITAGAEYVNDCLKFENVLSFEQILLYNPDVIIIGKKTAYKHIMNDKKWKKLKAVKNHNILFVPEEPFSWVEKKTIMEYFVIQYLAAKLYPELSNIDLHKELMEHINLFLHYPLTYNEAERLINYEKYYK